MKIWFGTTTTQLLDYKDIYFSIRDYLKEQGHIVIYDWLDTALEYRLNNPEGKRNIKNIFNEITTAIEEADAVIIEYTVPNFSSSHQITYALHKRKPTLVMRLHKDNTFSDSYIEALESPFLSLKDYTLANFKDVIDEFLGYSQIKKGMGRYNIVLDNTQKFYLDWASAKYKKSRSEIIRDALEDKVQNDNYFKKYIKH